MIFVTLGSQRFQFNRLLEEIDRLVGNGSIKDEVYAQVGYSDYKPKNFLYTDYMTREAFSKCIKDSTVVITHGGTGAIVNTIKAGKKIVAVPRREEFGEHVDNHQKQIVDVFSEKGFIQGCYNIDELFQAYEAALGHLVKVYESNTDVIIKDIEAFIESKKVKVLMVGNHKKVKGGITSVVNQLLAHDWRQENIQMTYIPSYVGGNNIKKILMFILSYGRIAVNMIFRRPHIIYMHMSYRGSFHRKNALHRLSRIFGVKTIIHLHGSEFKDWYDGSDLKVQAQIKKLLKESSKFIVLGQRWEETIKNIEAETNTVVVTNTIRIPEVRVSVPKDVVSFLFVGVLIERKGVRDLIHAVGQLKDRGVDLTACHFNIAGSGVLDSELKALTEELGIEKSIHFLGWVGVEDKESVMMENHILILPSYNEGLPIAILEAISYGMPVIATDVGDVSSAVLDQENGFLFKAGDVSHLAQLIELMILESQKGLWQRMSDKSREIAIDRFDEKAYFTELSELFRSVD